MCAMFLCGYEKRLISCADPEVGRFNKKTSLKHDDCKRQVSFPIDAD